MNNAPRDDRPLPFFCSTACSGLEQAVYPIDLQFEIVHELDSLLIAEADLILVGADDPPALAVLCARDWGEAPPPTLVAIALNEESGLSAVREGADDWVPAGDEHALERLVNVARARRFHAPNDSLAFPSNDLLFELAGTRASGSQILSSVRTLLSQAVEATAFADCGAVLLRAADGRYNYIAAEGYDLTRLRRVTLSEGELSLSGEPTLFQPEHLSDLERRLPQLGTLRRKRLWDAGMGKIRTSLVVPIGIQDELRAVLYLDGLWSRKQPGEEDCRTAARVAAQLALVLERAEFARELRGARDASLRTVGLLLERRDLETKGHTDRVVAMAERLAEHVGLGGEERQALRWGAYLHDVGKIALPDRILFKPDRLTDGEFAVVQKHADIGFEMIVDLPFLPNSARDLVRHHHERWNGRGYPGRLAGEEIPVLARLFSMVDVYDALSSKRPYKPAWPQQVALDNIREGAGREFDPEMAHAFVDMMESAGDGFSGGSGVRAPNGS